MNHIAFYTIGNQIYIHLCSVILSLLHECNFSLLEKLNLNPLYTICANIYYITFRKRGFTQQCFHVY